MNIETAKKAEEILGEIDKFEKYLFYLNNEKDIYLNIDYNEFVKIESRYKYMFIQAIENKIKELKSELEILV